MKISLYKGLYTLTETKNGITKTIASGWDKKELEQIKHDLKNKT